MKWKKKEKKPILFRHLKKNHHYKSKRKLPIISTDALIASFFLFLFISTKKNLNHRKALLINITTLRLLVNRYVIKL